MAEVGFLAFFRGHFRAGIAPRLAQKLDDLAHLFPAQARQRAGHFLQLLLLLSPADVVELQNAQHGAQPGDQVIGLFLDRLLRLGSLQILLAVLIDGGLSQRLAQATRRKPRTKNTLRRKDVIGFPWQR